MSRGKVLKEIMTETSQIWQRHKPIHSRNEENFNYNKPKDIHTKTYHNHNSEGYRQKKSIYCIGKNILMTVFGFCFLFFIRNHTDQKEVALTQILKENCQHLILYPMKITFKNKKKNQSILNEGKQRESRNLL
jgi:hypothetical protein